MSHPFYKMFYKALAKSTPEENLVLVEAEKLKEKGYSPSEIHGVLEKLSMGLVDDDESEIAIGSDSRNLADI